MTTATMPPKTAPPPVAKPAPATPTPSKLSIVSGRLDSAKRIVEYGPGGSGKTNLASLAPDPVFLDIEGGSWFLDVPRADGLKTFAEIRGTLATLCESPYKTVVVDSVTALEALALTHTLATVKNDQGRFVDNIEAYGFGKGYRHLYDTFMLFLADCDNLIRAGKNVILIAHDCTANVPNPAGEDYIRYEPHLQSPKSGQSSIRGRVIQWADYVLFLGYDVIAEDGKGRGSGTRTIFTHELPTHIAKSRTPIDNMPFRNAQDDSIWKAIFGGEK